MAGAVWAGASLVERIAGSIALAFGRVAAIRVGLAFRADAVVLERARAVYDAPHTNALVPGRVGAALRGGLEVAGARYRVTAIRDALAAGRKSMLTQAGNDMGVKEIFEAADRGDALAGELIDEMQEEVALLAANLIFALDPDAVLIGGGFTRRGGSFVRDIEARVKARVRFLPAEAIRVLPMALGDHAGIFGGAALAMTSAGEGAET